VRESKIRKLGKLEAYPTSVLASISAGSVGLPLNDDARTVPASCEVR